MSLGLWFDHGLGKGGNIIDFGLLFWKQLSFNEVVDKISEVIGSVDPRRKGLCGHGSKPGRPVYAIKETKTLGNNPAITAYLQVEGSL